MHSWLCGTPFSWGDGRHEAKVAAICLCLHLCTSSCFPMPSFSFLPNMVEAMGFRPKLIDLKFRKNPAPISAVFPSLLRLPFLDYVPQLETPFNTDDRSLSTSQGWNSQGVTLSMWLLSLLSLKYCSELSLHHLQPLLLSSS